MISLLASGWHVTECSTGRSSDNSCTGFTLGRVQMFNPCGLCMLQQVWPLHGAIGLLFGREPVMCCAKLNDSF